MLGFETRLQITFSRPIFSVCKVPASAAPLSTAMRTRFSISGGVSSRIHRRMTTTAAGE